MQTSSLFLKLFITLLLSFTVCFLLQAQPKKIGEVGIEDFSAYNSKYDSTMPAVVLFDYGEVRFDMSMHIYFTRHRRIKVLNDEGIEYSNVRIPLFKSIDQKVSDIEAASYNILDNGEIQISEMGENAIFSTNQSEGVDVVSYAVPNVKKGSIIDYTFTKRMGQYFQVPNWRFHDYIPVMWSEIMYTIPHRMQFRVVLKGNNDSLAINEVNQGGYYGSQSTRYHLAKENLYPVEDLPYLINREDYITEVITQYLGDQYVSVLSPLDSWSDIAKLLNNHEDFGGQRLKGSMKDKVDELIEGIEDPLEKIEKIYNYIVFNYEWDGDLAVLTDRGIRDAFDEKEGSTADLNMMLVEMLKHAGIKASPALISTRENGKVVDGNPLAQQFNMMVAVVEIDESAIMLDASSGKRSYTSPHTSTLYVNAFVIRDDHSHGWIFTYPLEDTFERISLNLSLSDSSLVHGTMSGSSRGVFAQDYRSDLEDQTPEEYWKDFMEDYQDVSIDSAAFLNLDSLSKEVQYDLKFTLNPGSEVRKQGDFIYLNPFLFLKRNENPFKREERELPVEFRYPYKYTIAVEVDIPEGYVVEELPQNAMIRSPEQVGFYRFISNSGYGKIQLAAQLSITNMLYYPSEYAQLKAMFQSIVDTQNTTVVLKKESSE